MIPSALMFLLVYRSYIGSSPCVSGGSASVASHGSQMSNGGISMLTDDGMIIVIDLVGRDSSLKLIIEIM